MISKQKMQHKHEQGREDGNWTEVAKSERTQQRIKELPVKAPSNTLFPELPWTLNDPPFQGRP